MTIDPSDPDRSKTHPPTPGADSPEPGRTLWQALRSLGGAGILGLAWVAMPPIGGLLLFAYMKSIAEWFKSHGDIGQGEFEGIGLYVVGFVVCAGLGLLPTYAQAILGGYAFGVWWGFVAALMGFTGAATLGYVVARYVSGERVMHLIESNKKARAVRDALVGDRHPLRTFGIVTLLRLPPNSPFAISNLVMAGVRVPMAIFIPATLLGMAPRTFAAVYFGSTLQVLAGKPDTPRVIYIAGIVLSVIVVIVIGLIAQRALERIGDSRGASGETQTEPTLAASPDDQRGLGSPS